MNGGRGGVLWCGVVWNMTGWLAGWLLVFFNQLLAFVTTLPYQAGVTVT